MSAPRAAAASLAVAVLVVGAALLYRLPFDQAAALAPVIVATVGATLFLVVLWAKVAYETLRRRRHPYRIVAGTAAAIGLLVVVSFFVDLPAGQ